MTTPQTRHLARSDPTTATPDLRDLPAQVLRQVHGPSLSEMLDRPIVGIAYTPSGFNNCHRNFPEMLEAVKRGVLAAGALPMEFSDHLPR